MVGLSTKQEKELMRLQTDTHEGCLEREEFIKLLKSTTAGLEAALRCSCRPAKAVTRKTVNGNAMGNAGRRCCSGLCFASVASVMKELALLQLSVSSVQLYVIGIRLSRTNESRPSR